MVALQMAESVRLPRAGGEVYDYTPSGRFLYAEGGAPPRSRLPYAAVHVVADPFADVSPASPAVIDWERTLAFRRHIWKYGLGVAEAMDTAQRGMGLDWEASKELIRRSVAEAKAVGGRIVCGAQTDHLAPGSARDLRDIEAAYEEQCEYVEKVGGQVVVMASRELARIARGPDDYARVYGRVLAQLRQPVIIHWLGEMFDPRLAGYWGEESHDKAMNVALEVIEANRAKVDGIKISLLDRHKEVAMRRRLPGGVRMYTGDDFNYAELIEGDGQGHSDALLGIFDAIAPAASAALTRLAAGDAKGFRDILAPTVPLARHIFAAPTRFYKTGLVFLAWLNGHQEHFVMVGGQQSARSVLDLAETFRLADAAGLLRDPELAASRMRHFLAVNGVGG